MYSFVIAWIIISLFSIGLVLLYCNKAKPYAKTESEKRALGSMMLLSVVYHLVVLAGLMIYPDSSQALAVIVLFSVSVYNIVFFIFAESISSISRRTMAAGAWPPFRGDVTTSATAIRIQSGISATGCILVLMYYLA